MRVDPEWDYMDDHRFQHERTDGYAGICTRAVARGTSCIEAHDWEPVPVGAKSEDLAKSGEAAGEERLAAGEQPQVTTEGDSEQ